MCGCVRGTTMTARGRDGEGGEESLDIFRCEATPAPVVDSQQPAARTSVCLPLYRAAHADEARGRWPCVSRAAIQYPSLQYFWGGDIWGTFIPTPQGAARPSDIRQTDRRMDASVSVGMKHGERGEKKKTHLSWDEECRRRRRLEGRRHAGQPSRRTCLSRRRIVWCVDGTVRYGGRWTVIRGGRDTRRAQQEKEEVGVDGVWRRMAEGRSGRTGDGRGTGTGDGDGLFKDPRIRSGPQSSRGRDRWFFSSLSPLLPAATRMEREKKSFDRDPESDRGRETCQCQNGPSRAYRRGGCHSSLGRLA